MTTPNPLLFDCALDPRAGNLFTEITLRDLFAAAVIGPIVGAIMANAKARVPSNEALASTAYLMADAMLAEREKGKP